MAIENQISIEFTSDDLLQIDEHIAGIENILKNKCINLTPEERQEYSRLGNRTENWSKKVIDYFNTQPNLVPGFINPDEANLDYNARQALMPRLNRLNAVTSLVDDTVMLLGSDLYLSCVAYYRNIKLLAGQNVQGAKTVYEDLAEQFPGRPSGKAAAKQ